ncbi:hypothetical protein Ahy_A02g006937 [Arachis hypogaea]|uniref:SWIM-type domain-containing protein n=1 Tax=Arachis hypogaea TaxID=3818 RepID=A0A445EBM7_ARAHY|nr:hypothetical protein Ahy_A02g006937 [Arachis hypogaea]
MCSAVKLIMGVNGASVWPFDRTSDTKTIAVIEKNRAWIPKMRVTHCDRQQCLLWRSLSPLRDEGRSFRVRLLEGTCDCCLFQSLHYPCRHALAGYAAASIEWVPYEAVFKVYKMESSSITDESMWAEWHRTRLCPNPVMRRKATERPVSTRFRNDIDETERHEKRCGLCRKYGHTRRECPNHPMGDV